MKYPEQDVIDAVITALEGGSNYWYFLPDVSMVEKDSNYALSERILRAVIFKGECISVTDAETTDVLGEISIESIERGIELYEEEREEFDAAMDADEADCLFQYIVMGEIVYA
jgi:hypothetical protein